MIPYINSASEHQAITWTNVYLSSVNAQDFYPWDEFENY